jgi:protocatechuate 3,4-dioxygenase beta subunit
VRALVPLLAAILLGLWFFLVRSSVGDAPIEPLGAPDSLPSLGTPGGEFDMPETVSEETLRVASVSSRAEPVRHLRLTARVVDERGEPLAGIACEFGFGLRTSQFGSRPLEAVEVLALATTDPRGEIELGLEVSEQKFGDEARRVLFGAVAEPGFLGTQDVEWLRSLDGDHVELRLVARRGWTICGLVHGRSGMPVTARVSLLRVGGAKVLEHLGSTNGEGAFKFDVIELGRYRVAAVRDGVGTASQEVRVADGKAPEEAVLQLVGEGVLRGVVVDGEGRPVPDLQLFASRAGGKPSREDARLVGKFETRGVGCGTGATATDPEGRFEIEGLAPGLFEIVATDLKSRFREKLLTETPVSSLGGELELVLVRSFLVVRVEDHLGRAVEPSLRFDRLPGVREATLVCVPPGPERFDSKGRLNKLRGSSGSDGTVKFELEAGESYALGVVSAKTSFLEEVVVVPKTGGTVERTLRLAPPSKPGTLRARVVGLGGVEVEAQVEFRVVAPVSGLVRERAASGSLTRSFEVLLPPGAYRVGVRKPFVRGGVAGPEREVVVATGTTSNLVFEL